MNQLSHIQIKEKINNLKNRGDHTIIVSEIVKEIGKLKDKDKFIIKEVIGRFTDIRNPWIFKIVRKFIKKDFLNPIIESLIQEADPSYQRYYIELLKLISKSEKLIKTIFKYIKDDNLKIKINAINSLYWIGYNEEIIKLLINIYDTEKEVMVIRSIIGKLSLVDLSQYIDFKDKITEIMNKSLKSDDEYIKNRAEIFFGQNIKLKSIIPANI